MKKGICKSERREGISKHFACGSIGVADMHLVRLLFQLLPGFPFGAPLRMTMNSANGSAPHTCRFGKVASRGARVNTAGSRIELAVSFLGLGVWD